MPTMRLVRCVTISLSVCGVLPLTPLKCQRVPGLSGQNGLVTFETKPEGLITGLYLPWMGASAGGGGPPARRGARAAAPPEERAPATARVATAAAAMGKGFKRVFIDRSSGLLVLPARVVVGALDETSVKASAGVRPHDL